MRNASILITEPTAEYELLDSGEGEKLERFGKVILSRPDPQALWRKLLPASEWKKADASFSRDENKGEWSLRDPGAGNGNLDRWAIEFGGLKLWIKPSSFKHVGLFPEQIANWEWTREKVQSAKSKVKSDGTNELTVLNLFGYTGGATLACAQAGASVVHVDSSKVAMTWARDNAELSGLKDKPVRWILDDARDFVRREIKRGKLYDGIIMDPPAFGHGPQNEVWKIEKDFLELVDDCVKLLKPQPLFFLINGYSAGYSAIAYENNLLALAEKFSGSIEIGELAIREGRKEKEEGRLLPAGIFARWSK